MRNTKHTIATVGAALIMVTVAACSGGSNNGAASSGSPAGQAAVTPSSTSKGGGASSAGVSLPDGWPSELALPDKTTVIEASKLNGTSAKAVARIDGDAEATYNALRGQLNGAGYEIVGSTFTPSSKGGFGSISAKGAKYTVAISFGPDATGKTSQVTINFNQVGP